LYFSIDQCVGKLFERMRESVVVGFVWGHAFSWHEFESRQKMSFCLCTLFLLSNVLKKSIRKWKRT
jgi:hypothetical protein